MRKLLFALAVLAVSAPDRAAAAYPPSTSATFPLLQPSGYYTNRYYYGWAYPWFAYYNYSHGPYANWMAWGGYATYGWPSHAPTYPPAPVGAPHPAHCTLTVTLPADARLLFNGVASTETGATRTYTVPNLTPGQEYAYDLTAERTVDGQTVREARRVVLRAGETAAVTLTPATQTAGR